MALSCCGAALSAMAKSTADEVASFADMYNSMANAAEDALDGVSCHLPTTHPASARS